MGPTRERQILSNPMNGGARGEVPKWGWELLTARGRITLADSTVGKGRATLETLGTTGAGGEATLAMLGKIGAGGGATLEEVSTPGVYTVHGRRPRVAFHRSDGF